jgi:hypothetical protein
LRKGSNAANLASSVFDVRLGKNLAKWFLQRRADELSVRRSKRKTSDRAKNAQILEHAYAWAPKFAKMVTNKAGGTRVGEHQLLNWDATTFYIEAGGNGQFHIVARRGQPRVSHAAMPRSSVAHVAPVIAADGSTAAIFVNIKANFAADFDASRARGSARSRRRRRPAR